MEELVYATNKHDSLLEIIARGIETASGKTKKENKQKYLILRPYDHTLEILFKARYDPQYAYGVRSLTLQIDSKKKLKKETITDCIKEFVNTRFLGQNTLKTKLIEITLKTYTPMVWQQNHLKISKDLPVETVEQLLDMLGIKYKKYPVSVVPTQNQIKQTTPEQLAEAYIFCEKNQLQPELSLHDMDLTHLISIQNSGRNMTNWTIHLYNTPVVSDKKIKTIQIFAEKNFNFDFARVWEVLSYSDF